MSMGFKGVVALVAFCVAALIPAWASASVRMASIGAINLNDFRIDIKDSAVIFNDPADVTYSNLSGSYTGYRAIYAKRARMRITVPRWPVRGVSGT